MFVIKRWLWGTLVPVGYPETVAEEYVVYQVWDSVQGLCSYLRGILGTKALLEAAGVGSESASVSAAAVAWALRDGFAMVASLVFSFAGHDFDRHPKIWRFIADVSNDVGMTLEVLTPYVCGRPSTFVLMTGVAAAFKTICGVAAAASKAVISAHLSNGTNFGDVAVKENAQEAMITLIGLLLGIPIADVLKTPRLTLAVFGILTVVHLWANYKAVRCLRLRTITRSRGDLLIHRFLENRSIDRYTIANVEPLLAFPHRSHVRFVEGDSSDVFVLVPQHREKNSVDVILRTDARPVDELRALFTAHRHLQKSTLTFDAFHTALVNHGWHVDRSLLDAIRYDPPRGKIPVVGAADHIKNKKL